MISNLKSSLVILAMGGLMVAGSAFAQTATSTKAGPGAVDPGHPRVNQVNRRETRQQKRIANGVKNGTLNPKETAHLEKREAALKKTEQADMAKNGGHLTKAQQRNLNHRENRISRSIKRDKTNGK
jgi:hypothetical protein